MNFSSVAIICPCAELTQVSSEEEKAQQRGQGSRGVSDSGNGTRPKVLSVDMATATLEMASGTPTGHLTEQKELTPTLQDLDRRLLDLAASNS